MDFNRFPWIYGNPKDSLESLDFNGFSWICMDFHGFQWIFIDLYDFAGFLWISIDLLESYGIH